MERNPGVIENVTRGGGGTFALGGQFTPRQYKTCISCAIAFIILQAFVIFLLRITIVRRGKVVEELQERDALRKSRAMLVEAQTVAQIGSWKYDVKTEELYWSGELFRIYGLDPQDTEASLEHGLGLIHPDDKEFAEKTFRDALNTGTPYEIEYRIIRADGEERFVQGIGKIETGENGEVLSVYGTGQDITEWMHAEVERKRLLEAEHRQRVLAETLAEVSLTLASQTSQSAVLDEILHQVQRIVPYAAANIALLEGDTLRNVSLKGYDSRGSETLVSDFVCPVDDLSVEAQAIRSQHPVVIPDTSQDPNWVRFDETVWIKSYLGVPICTHDHVLGLLRLDGDTPNQFSPEDAERLRPLANAAAIALKNAQLYESLEQELSERRRAEKSLTKSEQLLRDVIDADPSCIFLKDKEGRFLLVNEAMAKLHGTTPEAMLGKTDEDYIDRSMTTPQEIEAFHQDDLDVIRQQRPKLIPAESFTLLDGTLRWFQTNKVPVFIEGQGDCILGVAVDITRRQQAEADIETLAKFPSENPNPVLRVARDGTIMYANPASTALLRAWECQVTQQLPDVWQVLVADVSTTARSQQAEVLCGEQVLSLTFTPVMEADYVNVYGLDITKRKRSENKIEHLNTVLRAIRNVNQLIVREKDRDRLIQGVCDNLVETRGYHNAWIVLFDGMDRPGLRQVEGQVMIAEAGLGKEFLPMAEALKCGQLPLCGQQALAQSCVIVTRAPDSVCVDCPLAESYARRAAMTAHLEHETHVHGLLTVSIPANLAADTEEQALLQEVAQDIAFALHSIGLNEKREQAEDRLKHALAEKTTLLQELYHRTKNNMQVICALLDFQAAYIESERALQAFAETKKRIQSMALVHQKLYQSQDLSRINLREYIQDLAALLMQSYQIPHSKVTLVYDMEDVWVLIDTAIPCGIILNELISNALKYAFPGDRQGEIHVRLVCEDDATIELQVADNGVGVPENFDFRHDGQLGLQNVLALGEMQLQGQVHFEKQAGVTCRLSFKDNLYAPRV